MIATSPIKPLAKKIVWIKGANQALNDAAEKYLSRLGDKGKQISTYDPQRLANDLLRQHLPKQLECRESLGCWAKYVTCPFNGLVETFRREIENADLVLFTLEPGFAGLDPVAAQAFKLCMPLLKHQMGSRSDGQGNSYPFHPRHSQPPNGQGLVAFLPAGSESGSEFNLFAEAKLEALARVFSFQEPDFQYVDDAKGATTEKLPTRTVSPSPFKGRDSYKILLIKASERRAASHSAKLGQSFASGVEQARGKAVEVFSTDLAATNEAELVAALPEADLIVAATPLIIFGLSPKLDKLLSSLEVAKKTGEGSQAFVLISTAGFSEKKNTRIFSSQLFDGGLFPLAKAMTQRFCSRFGWKFSGSLFLTEVNLARYIPGLNGISLTKKAGRLFVKEGNIPAKIEQQMRRQWLPVWFYGLMAKIFFRLYDLCASLGMTIPCKKLNGHLIVK